MKQQCNVIHETHNNNTSYNDNEDSKLIIKSASLMYNISNPQIVTLSEIIPNNKLKIFINVHPFIYTNYRISYSLTDCFKSIFTLHNETGNIWTHIIAAIINIILLIKNIFFTTSWKF